MTTEWAIETRSLTKRFGARVAVDAVTLSVPPGSITALVGPNGAGKTTLMRTLLGFTRSSGGEAYVLGQPMPASRRSTWPRIGVIIEEPRFYPFLSGRRNLGQVARLMGIGSAKVDAALDRVGLGTRGDDAVGRYSLGMRQRLGIARALLAEPEVLVLDEPMNGLDPPGMREMRDLLRRFTAAGGSVLLSSHLLAELELLCDRVALLDRGRLVALGAIDEFGSVQPVVRIHASDAAQAASLLERAPGVGQVELRAGELYVTHDGEPGRAASFNRLLVEGGIDVDRLHSVDRSLEDRFIELVAGLDISTEPVPDGASPPAGAPADSPPPAEGPA